MKERKVRRGVEKQFSLFRFALFFIFTLVQFFFPAAPRFEELRCIHRSLHRASWGNEIRLFVSEKDFPLTQLIEENLRAFPFKVRVENEEHQSESSRTNGSIHAMIREFGLAASWKFTWFLWTFSYRPRDGMEKVMQRKIEGWEGWGRNRVQQPLCAALAWQPSTKKWFIVFVSRAVCVLIPCPFIKGRSSLLLTVALPFRSLLMKPSHPFTAPRKCGEGNIFISV